MKKLIMFARLQVEKIRETSASTAKLYDPVQFFLILWMYQ